MIHRLSLQRFQSDLYSPSNDLTGVVANLRDELK